MTEILQVSIPHRYAKNNYSDKQPILSWLVSIPHRYAKNGDVGRWPRFYTQFQFLIGTLKTYTAYENRGYMPAFQFLIGTLKTWAGYLSHLRIYFVSIPHRYAKNYFFQPTLGTSLSVSIPHRYAKNFLLLFSLLIPIYVSIPHRYAKNALELMITERNGPMFQFLIGTLKTKQRYTIIIKHYRVSIPHRYAKNWCKEFSIERMGMSFQFLIGTLKTVFSNTRVAYVFLFQFLIGTLKTGAVGRTWWDYCRVSIPHRYAKNKTCARFFPNDLRVSIPHRYAKN